MIIELHTVMSNVWQSSAIPPDWERELVVLILKGKEDRQDCIIYRVIKIFSAKGRMLAHLLLMQQVSR